MKDAQGVFRPELVKAEHAPALITTMRALMHFLPEEAYVQLVTQSRLNKYTNMRNHCEILEAAGDGVDRKTVLRAAVALFNATFSRSTRFSRLSDWFDNYWNQIEPDDIDAFLQGLQALSNLSPGSAVGSHIKAITEVTHRAPRKEIRSARAWLRKRTATFPDTVAILMSTALTEELRKPDWAIVGDPPPPVVEKPLGPYNFG